jgi:hypothetical protein
MKWTILKFGKHAGKTLPEIVITDADWFFWAIEKRVFKGGLEFQAADLCRKVQAIKVPKRRPRRWQVEYRYEDNGRFLGLQFVKVGDESTWCSGRNYRSRYLDLTYVRRRRWYDKKGCRCLLRDFRRYYFGERRRLTKGKRLLQATFFNCWLTA